MSQPSQSRSGWTRRVSPVDFGGGTALLFRVKRTVVSSQLEPQSRELCGKVLESQHSPTDGAVLCFVVSVGGFRL